ncbi:MAG: cobalamin B12-binding domain-containing protein [Myxococcales bacterium]|nr:cobalamin B12-binding domain-containing protein [Myxococcales bacterium]
MSKGLLVTCGGYPYTPSSLFPDNGLATLAAVLQAAGHRARVWDLNTLSVMERLMTAELRADMRRLVPLFDRVGRDAEATAFARGVDARMNAHMAEEADRMADDLIAELRGGAYDWVGFKLYMGDGLRNSVHMAERVKAALPRVKVFAGGPQVDLVGAALFRRSAAFDAVATAEGEPAIVALAEWVDGRRRMDEVPNVVWRDGTRPRDTLRVDDLGALPLPAYDVDTYPAMAGDEKLRILTYDESRGCPYTCAFCIHASKSGVRRRVKPADHIVAELTTLRRRHDTRGFRFAGSATPFSTMADVSRALTAAGTDLLYSAYATPHGLDPRLLPTLTEGGLWGLFFGVESGSPRVLADGLGKKKNRVAQMERTLGACLDAGVFTVASILYPAPGEDEHSTAETLDFLRRVFRGRDHFSIPVTFAGLFPNTPWFRERERYGFEIEDEQRFLHEVMDYRIKALMPYALWPEANYKLDGKRQVQLAMQAGQLLATLRGEGFTTMLLDDTALVATLAGIPLENALDRLVAMFLTGDMSEARALAHTVNARLAVNGGPLPRARPAAHDAAA